MPDGLRVRATSGTGESGTAMGYGAILVAYEGSAPSNRALADALELVECGLGTRVVVLSVSDPLKMEDPAFVAAARAACVLLSLGGDEKASLEALKEQVADRIAEHEGVVDLRVAFGKPGGHRPRGGSGALRPHRHGQPRTGRHQGHARQREHGRAPRLPRAGAHHEIARRRAGTRAPRLHGPGATQRVRLRSVRPPRGRGGRRATTGKAALSRLPREPRPA